MKLKRSLFLPFILIFSFFVGKRTNGSISQSLNESEAYIIEEFSPNLTIHEGLVSQEEQTIWINRSGRKVGYIKLSKPIVVAQAERDEPWGFFQFPNLSKTEMGGLVVSWHMKEDTYESYGKGSQREYRPMISGDEGRTWAPLDYSCYLINDGYDCHLFDSSTLRVITPPAKDIKTYEVFPKEVFRKGIYSFYHIEDVPPELQGVYLYSIDKKHTFNTIHASLEDPGLLRYTINDKMPIVWWGNIRQLADSTLVAGVYPCKYIETSGNDVNSGVSFYSSKDRGKSWEIHGRIPFRADGIADRRGDGSYDEPTFEVLKDESFICVMRTGSTSPMYKSFSYDKGITWTQPVPFTANGVLPWLKLLRNGILVLSSGRPGVQIRFSLDGTGKLWTTPVDMLPFMNSNGSYTRDVSCGYTSIMEAGDNSFYLVYSDFNSLDINGLIRKAIMFRKIEVGLIN